MSQAASAKSGAAQDSNAHRAQLQWDLVKVAPPSWAVRAGKEPVID